MAKGRKTGGRDMKPGETVNPNGRPPMPPELKEIRRMTRSEVELRILELWQKPEPEIKAILDDPKTSLRDKMIMRVMLRAIAKGDHAGLGFIMDTTFGKQAQKQEISGPDGSPIRLSSKYDQYTTLELQEMAKRIAETFIPPNSVK